MKIWLIRHGKTLGNLQRRYVGGRTDQPLCREGIEELEALAESGGYPSCGLLVSSPMKRCIETCGILCPHQKPIVLEELRETDFGLYDGLTYEEITSLSRGEEFDLLCESPFPGGESRSQVRERSLQGLARAMELARQASAESLTLITHGGIIMALLSALFPGTGLYEWHPENGRGFGVEVAGPGCGAVYLGKTPLKDEI